MADYKRGVTEEPRALYTHCYGHSLNLAMCGTIKQCRLTRDTMDVTNEISKLTLPNLTNCALGEYFLFRRKLAISLYLSEFISSKVVFDWCKYFGVKQLWAT